MAQIEVQGVNLVADEFERYPRRAQQIIVRALQRGGDAADTLMSRAVAADMGIKVSVVKEALRRRKPSIASPEYRLAAGFKRIALYDFSASPKEPPSRGRGRGVSYRMGKGNPRSRIANAFIARLKSGHVGVFARIGKARLPIRELRGPSLGHVFAKYRAEALARGLDVFETTLNHELERADARD